MEDNKLQILDASGVPIRQSQPKVSALAGVSRQIGGLGAPPYDAANVYDNRLETWLPWLGSPDSDLNQYRDRIVARTRDLIRNDGWASGAVKRTVNNTIGSSFRPISKPDYQHLALHSGNKAFDPVWAAEFGKALEAHWRDWANDPLRYCDLTRHLTVSQIFRLGFRHRIIDGDVLAIMHWKPDRIGRGAARYASAIQMVDPDRLSNPQNQFDTRESRGGVKIDKDGVALGYYIRQAHVGDWWAGGASQTWDLVPRETAWGRPMVFHDYDHDRAAQHRGGAGLFTPILQRMKMLVQYDGTELDAAIINAIFGAYVQSPFDPEIVQSALGSSEDLNGYQAARSDFHKDRNISLGGARIPILFPGESINAVTAARPNTAFPEFQSTMLRNIASSLGMSYEQMSLDWSKSNYSSARGAIIEAWRNINAARDDYSAGFCSPIFSNFVEESMERDDLPLPKNAPDFLECRGAYSRARWLGPGKGYIDPTKEKEGAMLGMEAGLSTLELEAAENGGLDWLEILDQRQIELAEFEKRGIPVPSWGRESDEEVKTQKVG